MKVSCPSCQTNYNIDDKRIPPGGAKLKCAKCQTTFTAGGKSAAAGVVPLPGAAPSATAAGAIPLPGAQAPKAPGAVAPPAASGASAVALPGGRAQRLEQAGFAPKPVETALDFDLNLGGDAVPLPGFGPPEGGANPFDAYAGPESLEEQRTQVSRVEAPSPRGQRDAGSIPLPGASHREPAPEPAGDDFGVAEDFGAIPLPPDDGAVPLPGFGAPQGHTLAYGADFNAARGEPPLAAPAAPDFSFDTGGASGEAPAAEDDFSSLGFSSSTPAASSEADVESPFANYEEEQRTQVRKVPIPAEAYQEPASAAEGIPDVDAVDFDRDVTARMPAPDALDFADADLVEPPPASPPSSAAPAADLSFSFDDLPAPGPSSAQEQDAAPQPEDASGFDFDVQDLPAPSPSSHLPPLEAPRPSAPSSDADFGFDSLPAPAQSAPAGEDPLLDFALPPPPAGTPTAEVAPDLGADFGGVDLQDAGGAGGSAEVFDPDPDFGAAAPTGGGRPQAPVPTDLDFVEDNAPPAASSGAPTEEPGGEVTRFHVRRRSGKTFGPFDEAALLGMLADGQLLGNEDISTDGDTWMPIGSHEAFSAAAQSAAAKAARKAPAGRPEAPPVDAKTAETMERLKTLYDGRMAAVAVVDGGGGRLADLRKLLLPALVGLVVLGVVGTGLGLGMTRYGVFGLKALLPNKVAEGTPAATALQTAKTDLLADTYRSYRDAKELTDTVLRQKEYPEVRAVWCQAVFYLSRRYAASTPAEVNAASAALEGVSMLGAKHPEVVKALAGEALNQRKPDAAIALLEPAWGQAGLKSRPDVELALLLAEAYAAKGQSRQAMDLLKRALTLNKDSAKALHALGNLQQSAGQADAAEKAYEEALKADPQHVNSALELAAVEMLLRKDVNKGMAALDKALDDKVKARLGPAELARAQALKGVGFLMSREPAKAIPELEAALKLDKDAPFIQFNLARAYAAQRDYERALPLFKSAAEREPQNLASTEGYLQTLVDLGKMSDALTAVTQANTRFPGNAHIAYLFARVDDALEHGMDAEAHYQRAIEGDPKLTEASLGLARFYLKSHKVAEASAVLNAALQRSPADPDLQSALGEVALAQGDLPGAKAQFEKALATAPNQADAHLGLSRVAFESGKLDEAKTEVDRALALDPKVRGGRLHRGTVLWKSGDLDGAGKELELAKSEDPTNVKTLVTLGAVKLAQNDLASAESNILAALGSDPTSSEANFYLARIKDRRSMFTDAIDTMHAALERAPKKPEYHYEMGIILRDAKRLPEAMEEWRTTLKLDPQSADAYEALGQAYLEQGKYDDAVDAFKSALKADPGRARVQAAIGDSYFQQAKWNDAIRSYEEALKADPNLKYAYYKIGRAYGEQAQQEKAIGWYLKATQLDKQNAMPYYYLGYAYKERGRKSDAVAAFNDYLRLSPDATDKKDIQDEIYDLSH